MLDVSGEVGKSKMRGVRFRLSSPTIAVMFENGEKVAVTVPAGETVAVLTDPVDGSTVLDVEFQGKLVEMFVQDVRDRGQRVGPESNAAAT